MFYRLTNWISNYRSVRKIGTLKIQKRIKLIPANGISSIYPEKFKNKLDISAFNNVGQRGNFITPDMFEALQKLDESIKLNKGTFQIIDLFRSWEVQAESREKYEINKKTAFVARPGYSFHNAGRAVDVDVKNLKFLGKKREDWLKLFWKLANPIGFKPIISIPDIDASESWHFDFPGKSWERAYTSLDYDEVAKCAVLDVGEWNPDVLLEKTVKMFVQAQLIRLGYFEIGEVDGIHGSKTLKVLDFLGMKDWSIIFLAAALSKRGR